MHNPTQSHRSVAVWAIGAGLVALVAVGPVVCAPTVALATTTPVAVAPPPPNIIRNGAFVNPPVPAGQSYKSFGAGSNAIPGWSVGGDGVELYAPSFMEPPPNARTEVRLGNGTPGDIEQAIATTPGWTYQLTYYAAGEPGGGQTIKTLHVFWDKGLVSTPSFSIAGRSFTNMGWTYHHLVVTATSSSSTLEFADVTPNNSFWSSMVANIGLAAVAKLFLPTATTLSRSGQLVAYVRSYGNAPITDTDLKVTLYGTFAQASYAPPATQEIATAAVLNGTATLRVDLPKSLAGKTIKAYATMAGPKYIPMTEPLTIKVS